MLELPLEHGTLLLDDEDAHLLEGKKVASYGPYGVHRLSYRVMVGRRDLGRLLLNPPEGLQVDHINHDTFDNRRQNLRVVTRSQNLLNRRGWATKGGHGYKGLKWRKKDQCWVARVVIDGVRKERGSSVNPHKAALKWNKAAIAAYGEYVYPNDVPCFSDSPKPRDERCLTCHAVCHCCCVCP